MIDLSENPFFTPEMPTPNNSIIKVIGVGGGGSNAVNLMYGQGIKDVDFVICNTDLQHLNRCSVPRKLQIGAKLTNGLGAGTHPEMGRSAALESEEDIRTLLSDNTRMVFITAGMGGGTGTGAAPVIARIAKELGLLTVAIVTMPFMYEGPQKTVFAHEGIKELSKYCDCVLEVLNDKLQEIFGNMPVRRAFQQADEVLSAAAKSIAEIITNEYDQNVDYNDVDTVLKNSGSAVFGKATAIGKDRAEKAVVAALNSPLLNNRDIKGAKSILIALACGDGENEISLDENSVINTMVQEACGGKARLKTGIRVDSSFGEKLDVIIIATGFTIENPVSENLTAAAFEDHAQAEEAQMPTETVATSAVDTMVMVASQMLKAPDREAPVATTPDAETPIAQATGSTLGAGATLEWSNPQGEADMTAGKMAAAPSFGFGFKKVNIFGKPTPATAATQEVPAPVPAIVQSMPEPVEHPVMQPVVKPSPDVLTPRQAVMHSHQERILDQDKNLLADGLADISTAERPFENIRLNDDDAIKERLTAAKASLQRLESMTVGQLSAFSLANEKEHFDKPTITREKEGDISLLYRLGQQNNLGIKALGPNGTLGPNKYHTDNVD